MPKIVSDLRLHQHSSSHRQFVLWSFLCSAEKKKPFQLFQKKLKWILKNTYFWHFPIDKNSLCFILWDICYWIKQVSMISSCNYAFRLKSIKCFLYILEYLTLLAPPSYYWFFKNFIVPTLTVLLFQTHLPCIIFFMKTNDIKWKSKHFIQTISCFWHSNYAVITSFEPALLIALVIIYVAL